MAIRTSCTVADDHCKCFEALTEEQTALLEKKQVTVEYNKGEIIAKHGAFASHVVFLCEGLVKVYLEHGKQTLILKIISELNDASTKQVILLALKKMDAPPPVK